MTPELESKIQAAIKDALPSAVCAELQDVLAKAASDAKALEKALARIVELDRERQQLQRQVETLNARVKNEVELAQKDADITKREQAMTVTLLESRLEGATKMHDNFMALMQTVFRNPVVKETVTNSRSGYESPSNGGAGLSKSSNDTATVLRTTE